MEPEEQVDRSGRNERKGVLAEGTAWAKPESFVWWWGVRGVCTSGARRSLKSGGVRSAEPCVRSCVGDTRDVGSPGPVALPSSRGVDAPITRSEPRLYSFIYEVPGMDSIAY